MPQEKVKKIHLIYGCIAAVLIVALGIALMASCLDIYHSAPSQPYSAEAVAQQFQKISVLIYAVIAVVAGGIALSLALPIDASRIKARRDETEAMNRLKAKVGELDGCGCSARKEQTYRKACKKITAGLCILLAIYPVIYYSDWSHFPIQNLNDNIIKAVTVALVPAAIGLALCFVCSLLCSKSIARETAIYKRAIAANKSTVASRSIFASKPSAAPIAQDGSEQPMAQTEPKQTNRLLIARSIVLVAAICFIVLGMFNGGVQDVLTKAIAICTECIGLG